ncbi:enoyl-[acyl-carrier-protein] reductase FabL [soil metagenome]
MKNKIALITGSAKRLGKFTAIELARSGFDIVLHYNNSDKEKVEDTANEVSKFNTKVVAFKADLSEVAEIKSLFYKLQYEFKDLNVLINNAGIFEGKDFFDIDEKFFDKFINVNLKSYFFCSQSAAKLMMQNDSAINHIVNMASLGGILNWTRFMPYGISKAGVIKLTKLLSVKLAPKILVNAIAPGTILTGEDENDNFNKDDIIKYPMKKFGDTDDISSVIKYLVIENKYITGQIIAVDGGRSANI